MQSLRILSHEFNLSQGSSASLARQAIHSNATGGMQRNLSSGYVEKRKGYEGLTIRLLHTGSITHEDLRAVRLRNELEQVKY